MRWTWLVFSMPPLPAFESALLLLGEEACWSLGAFRLMTPSPSSVEAAQVPFLVGPPVIPIPLSPESQGAAVLGLSAVIAAKD